MARQYSQVSRNRTSNVIPFPMGKRWQNPIVGLTVEDRVTVKHECQNFLHCFNQLTRHIKAVCLHCFGHNAGDVIYHSRIKIIDDRLRMTINFSVKGDEKPDLENRLLLEDALMELDAEAMFIANNNEHVLVLTMPIAAVLCCFTQKEPDQGQQ